MNAKNYNLNKCSVYTALLLLCLVQLGCNRDKHRLSVQINKAKYVKGQIVSSHDGFYTSDSVFYELWGTDSFEYCVNCYSADSLKKYKGGVWLYSREHAPNTWENNPFSKPSYLSLFEDTGHVRADVVKANTIWVRIFNDTGYTDEHHLVFLGKWRPKTAEVISVFIDSSDFLGPDGFYGPGKGEQTAPYGMQWNYLLKKEKNCCYEIFGGKDWQLEAAQTAGIQTSAFQSQAYPNKSVQLNADRTSNKVKLLSLGNSLTDSLGQNIKVLRLRVGGPLHKSYILTNEIALAILDTDIGGAPTIPVCLFINGSFWTYTFAEEGMGRNRIAKMLKTTGDQLITAKILPAYTLAEIKDAKITLTHKKGPIYSLDGFFNTSFRVYMENGVVEYQIDTTDTYHDPLAFESLNDIIKHGSDSLLAASINREAFYKYALSQWFFQNEAMWGGSLTAAKAGEKPWTLVADHYYFRMPDPAMTNDWNIYFTDIDLLPADGGSRKTPAWKAAKRMFDYDRDYFCLVLEDELNTTYKPERIVSIAQKKIASFRPCITEGSKAWYPYGWQDSVSWEATIAGVIPFLSERPLGIAAALPKIFLSGKDTLLQLHDQNIVTVNFDKVKHMGVVVKLNSLELSSNFTGKYYPKPELRISLQYDTRKYEFVKWLEYPAAPATFKLSANKSVSLTPVLKPKE